MKKFKFSLLKPSMLGKRSIYSGETLVEVIVALGLLTIVAIFVCETLLFGINLISKAKNSTKNSFQTAGNVAQKTINSATSSYPSGTTVTTSSGSFTITFSDDGSSASVSANYVTGTTSGQTYTNASMISPQ
jgi:uncharacterized protein (UPF0333 family)